MHRLSPRDRFLGIALLGVWAVCLVLGVESQLRGPGFSSVYVAGAEGPDAYPIFVGLRPWYPGESDPGLVVGDALIRVGETDLRGRGPFGFFLAVAEGGRKGRVALVYERNGRPAGVSLRVAGYVMPWPALFASLVTGATMAIGLARVAPTPLLLAGFYGFIALAIWLTSWFGGPPALTLTSVAVHVMSLALVSPLLLRAALLFPHGRPPQSAWLRYGPWAFAVTGLFGAASTFQIALPPAVADVGAYGATVAAALLVAVVMAFAWRRADPVERRQIKWVVWGVCVAALPILATAFLSTIWPQLSYFYFLSLGALGFVPVAVLIAVYRYDFLDIDRLLSATASYNLLAILLVGAGLVLVPRAAEAAASIAGLSPEVGQVAFSLLLAAAVVPAHARLRPWVESVFFRERATMHHGMEALLDDLSACADAGALIGRFGEGVAQLFRPTTAALYAPGDDEVWQPVWADGAAVPPAFPRESAFLASLARRRRPVDLAGRHVEIEVDALERAALATLDTEVVVPARRRDVLAAFLCLGPQQSGDIYTAADLALLSAVAEKVSTELLRFDEAEILRQERGMQDRLRRYVPGAVADTLACSESLEDGEREIAVLFCDIRGYTAYSEGRGAAEIFSAINRYTEVASEVVRAHGGSVVEFLGDGLMAVFGAPGELPDKEAAAVAAGRGIAAAVDQLSLEAPERGADLSVGVGVATGMSFVGSIKAADRDIWTAIGNAVNLASRLQSLTRDLAAAVAIDTTTHAAAGPAVADFSRRSGVKVKGRSQPLDVWVLEL